MSKKLTEEQLKSIKYLNPNTNTHFSIPLGFGSVKAHMKRAAECGFMGFSITDSTVMGGVLEAYKLSKDKDFLTKTLKKESFPIIIGAKVNIIDDLAKRDKVNKFFPLTIYAKDATGYKNLVTLVSIASDDEHFFMKPRISLPELIEYGEGLVVTSGDINGMIAQSILKETEQEELLIEIFKEHFGDNFFIEMHYHDRRMQWNKDVKDYVDSGNDPQKVVNLRLMELAKKHKIKCLLTQNSSMPKKQNYLQQKIMIANNPAFKDGWKPYQAYYTMPVEEMYEDVQQNSPYITDEQFVEWCNNTQLLFDKCKDIKLSFTPKLPNIIFSEALVNRESEWEDKYQAMKISLKERQPNLYELFEVGEEDISLKTAFKIMIRNGKVNFEDKVSCDRLSEELRVIQRNGIIQLCDYFLLLEDVTHFVRENGYLRGFGRGSGAGSLVAYALDITDCDPLVFDLLFERFLTKERVGKLNFEIEGFDFNLLSKD